MGYVANNFNSGNIDIHPLGDPFKTRTDMNFHGSQGGVGRYNSVSPLNQEIKNFIIQ